MNKTIENTLIKYTSTYRNIFEKFYPATDSDGFVERNQTNIFVNALLENLMDNDAFAWFEMSLDKVHNDKKKGHIDAVVFSPKHFTVFYIEAKRLSTYRGNFEKRIASISEDFSRILNKQKRESIIKRSNFKITDEYVICLADFWKSDTIEKFKYIPQKWIDNDIYNDKLKYLSIEFNQGNYFDKAIEKYNLLVSYTKI